MGVKDTAVMRLVPLVLALRLLFFIAIAASAALAVEYMNAGDPAFCGVGSGCLAVRMSGYSSFFNVPLPFIGLFAYSALFAASLLARTSEHHRYVALFAAAGGAAALALIVIQKVVVGAFCAWCVAVDGAAIGAAVVAILIAQKARENPPSAGPVETLIWGVAAALAIALPFFWGRYPVIPPTPPAITTLAVPDKLTIVGFTDFQCPFCRKLHPIFHDLEKKYGDRIHYTRRMYPLPSHPGAIPAAQAYVCTPDDKREAAADWLYTAPDGSLTRAGVLEMADAIGVPKATLAECMTSRDTQKTIAREKQMYETLGARGLPLTYVGSRMVIGFNPERIESAIETELEGGRISLKLEWLFVALGVVLAGALFLTWRIKRSEAPRLVQQ